MLQGFLDVATATTIAGWAWDPVVPFDAIYVDIYDGTIHEARVRADLYRRDLADAGIGNGCHGFRYDIAESQLDGAEHVIHVRFAESGIELTHSPREVLFGDNPHRTPALASAMRALAPVTTWNIDGVAIEDEAIVLSGWALPSLQGEHGTFAVDDAPVSSEDRLRYPHWRPDVANVFWYVPRSALSGFVLKIGRPPRNVVHHHLKIDYIDPGTSRPWKPYHSFFIGSGVLEPTYPLPPAENMLRVAGYTDKAKFLLDGYTTVLKLRSVIRSTTNRDIATFRHILDWGCGCGRIVRHLLEETPHDHGPRVTGIDIDSDNIAWCQANLERAAFIHVPLQPPTEIPDASFDLVFGMSVFTHLDEATQFRWLAELNRLMSPGGLFVATIHGPSSVSRVPVDEAWLRRLQVAGIDDGSTDSALDSVIRERGYYRATYHTHDYIRKRWGEHFEIVHVEDSFLSNNQDMVVLRKRLT